MLQEQAVPDQRRPLVEKSLLSRLERPADQRAEGVYDEAGEQGPGHAGLRRPL